ncbi:10256_t:CDS:2 [Paraglomus occultum]|uniref:10256_t:CDS:1 n=1 Tax=Paraglomus occultum TaxID=144539 RepID=A0A9N9AMP3_9GLOM|nr:10256_t:CDS:2 [Paraglomus occultum]
MTDLDKILGELQLEVEELTADLERSASQEQMQEYSFNKDRDSQESQYSLITSTTNSSVMSTDSSGTSPDKERHTDHSFEFSIELMQEELIKLNSSLNKRPTYASTNPQSSQTQFNVSPSNADIGLQKSSHPRLPALQTIFSSTISSPGQSTASSPISASTTTTSSPVSPNGDNNVFRNIGKNTDNTSPDALVPNITALAGFGSISPAESPPISLTSSPRLGARTVSTLWNDSEDESENESDSDSSSDSESETDSDDSGSSDFNPLSLSRKRVSKPVSDKSGDAANTNRIRRSVTNGHRQSPPNRGASPAPSPNNSSNQTAVTPTGAKITRKGTTARGLGSRVRVKPASQPSSARLSKDPLPPTPVLPKSYIDSEKEPNRIREQEVDSRQSLPRGRVADNYTKGRSKSRDPTYDRESSNPSTRGRELEARDPNKYQGQRKSTERRSVTSENDPRQLSGRRASPTRGRPIDRNDRLTDRSDRPSDRSDRHHPNDDTTVSRSRSVNRDQGNRGRSRSLARNSSPKPSRPLNQSRSRTRDDDRGRSGDRSTNVERSRSKSQSRVNGKSRTPGGEVIDMDFEKERDKVLERNKNSENKEKSIERSKTRREKKSEQADKEIKITTRIYIGDIRQFKTLALTSKMNALSVLKYLKRKQAVPDSDEWTLFELVNDLGLERPLRDWEIVTNVINTWDTSRTTNALVCKTYAYRHTLTVEGLNNGVPPLFGWLHLKLRKNKWEKRYIYLRDGAIYHAKDAKGGNETFLCTIASFDVYTITKPLKRAPTKFAFALKSQDRVTMFESPEQDYVHFLCAEHMEKMKDWVLSIRNAKAQLLLEERPELFQACVAKEDILSPTVTSPQSDKTAGLAKGSNNEGFQTNGEGVTSSASDQWATLRRAVRYQPGKSSRKFDFSDNAVSVPPAVGDDGNKKSEANNGNFDAAVFKPGSLLSYDEKNPPLKQVEQEEVSWAKGSLLASSDAINEQKEKERREERWKERERAGNGTTLVHLNNGVQFNKGSLLDKSRSDNAPSHNGTFLNIHEERTFSKGSLLAQKKKSVENLSSNRSRSERQPNGPLLSIDHPTHHQSRSQTGFTTHSGNGPLLTLDLPPSQHRTPHNVISPTSPGSTLLQLDLKHDAQHTLALRSKDIKPLVSFVPGEKSEGRETKREQGKTLVTFNNGKEGYDDNEYSSEAESTDE